MTGAPDETCAAASARVYSRMGWAVFPVWWPSGGLCACPTGRRCTSPGKHPITRRGLHDASGDEAVIAAWWSRWPQANVGLAAGDNRLAILDVDPRHGGGESLHRLAERMTQRGISMPKTPTVVTGSNGMHLYFAAPEGGVKGGSNVFGPDAPGLDVRGRGGYVVAPPSRHISGDEYVWLNFLDEFAPWPPIFNTLAHVEVTA